MDVVVVVVLVMVVSADVFIALRARGRRRCLLSGVGFMGSHFKGGMGGVI